jgi:hypothetical protein
MVFIDDETSVYYAWAHERCQVQTLDNRRTQTHVLHHTVTLRGYGSVYRAAMLEESADDGRVPSL